ncbi:tetratricopeptide repeat protein [Streptosporangium sp. NBC_01639]|uniref:tetratricopeptide repeat protein n=1 Tax=Streptosporangium sp. NBC_01639 TaxID=2975948 RepID=UPI003862E3E2|nr:tetratricopeptide repeat protein [Streptosporangium sp. NBC_01639]
MSQHLTYKRNAFQETLIGLEYTPYPGETADIYSRACVEAFADVDWTQFGYPFTQVFEPGVLHEVSFLEGVPYENLADLSYRPTSAMKLLGDLVDNAAELGSIGRINLASSLVNTSRFNLAERVLSPLAGTEDPREAFEVAWLEFMISNRRDDGRDSPAAFTRMRAAVLSGVIPRARILDACTQAVVWYLKRREVTEDDFRWYVTVGNALAKEPDRLAPSAVSSWYRGLAMLPAAKGMPAKTRSYMRSARVAAEQAVEQNSGALELNFVKTYYESSLKEHMYVSRDFERAVESGRALIELDPVWAPSYGELADAYDKFGQVEKAAGLFIRAAELGPPYVGHHLLRAADCEERIGDYGSALSCYSALAEMAPRSAGVLRGGLRCAQEIGHESTSRFERALKELNVSAGPSEESQKND